MKNIHLIDGLNEAGSMARQIMELGYLIGASKRGGNELDAEATGGLVVNMASALLGVIKAAEQAAMTTEH
jgi:hypothetical protein